MYTIKQFKTHRMIQASATNIMRLSLWSAAVILLYERFNLHWLKLPWLPMSLVGTALAFYLGFKNSSAYDRMWEARKIWGAIINSSRAWGSAVKSYVSPFFTEENIPDEEVQAQKQKLIYRHIVWLYTLRSQLLVSTEWENASQKGRIGRYSRQFKEKRLEQFSKDLAQVNLEQLLPEDEYSQLSQHKNMATQLIDKQAQDLAQLRTQGLIEDFRHMELQKILNDFYIHQGKCERIKKFPLPRQYASMSYYFVMIFISLLPISLVAQFNAMGEYGHLFAIPFSVLVGWVFLTMEVIGDYSENPFQGLANDIPMLSLCRVIEIDLREMLGETDLPEAVLSQDGILM